MTETIVATETIAATATTVAADAGAGITEVER